MEIPLIPCRIFIGESDRFKHPLLYEAIILRAREMHLAGATVLRGPMGFGKSSRMHTSKILRLSMGSADRHRNRGERARNAGVSSDPR